MNAAACPIRSSTSSGERSSAAEIESSRREVGTRSASPGAVSAGANAAVRRQRSASTIADGVQWPHTRNAVEVAAGASVEFARGGKHLMLIGAGPGNETGSQVDIELAYADGLLLVSATLLDRRQAD